MPAVTGRARGQCPSCGRIITGRAEGIETAAAARRYVILAPHVRNPRARRRIWCLTRGDYVKVPRWTGQG